jgi:hypothetical protein
MANMEYNPKMGAGSTIRARRWRIGSACVVVALCLLSSCLSPATAGAESPAAKLAGLRLWSALPTRHFIELGGESTSRSRWEAFAFRAPRSTDPGKVCVSIVSALLYKGVLSYGSSSPDCGPVGKAIKAPVLLGSGLGQPTRSAFVVVTGTESVKASVATDVGKVLEAPLRTVEGRRAHKGGLRAFRYALLVSREEGSIQQVIGFGHNGAVEFETPSPSGGSGQRT